MKDDEDWVRKSLIFEVIGKRSRERPRKILIEVVEKDMGMCSLLKEGAVTTQLL